MEVISFTAGRQMPAQAAGVIYSMLALELSPVVPAASAQVASYRFVTGGAVGGDAFIGRHLAETRPWDHHLVVVPARVSQVDDWWRDFQPLIDCGHLQVEWMPEGTSYKDRNARLVRLADRLLGFPAFSEFDPRARRSGSWQTIRLARKAPKPVRWWTLDGQDGGVSGVTAVFR